MSHSLVSTLSEFADVAQKYRRIKHIAISLLNSWESISKPFKRRALCVVSSALSSMENKLRKYFDLFLRIRL